MESSETFEDYLLTSGIKDAVKTLKENANISQDVMGGYNFWRLFLGDPSKRDNATLAVVKMFIDRKAEDDGDEVAKKYGRAAQFVFELLMGGDERYQDFAVKCLKANDLM